jgi:hypothetical protein
VSKRDYAKEYREYHGKPEQKARRAARGRARTKLENAGLVRKGDGMDVDHRNMNPHDNRRSNLRVQPKSVNRARNGK